MKLIYHQEKNENSVFDKEIIELVKENDIKIVCPYIGMSYIDRIIKLSKSWKLITDVEELLLSNSLNSRNDVKNFIIRNHEKIHHCKDIHAKVLTSKNKAFLGSSNFTEKGIQKRVEMSVTIEDNEKVQELNDWFDDLWIKTDTVVKEELSEYIEAINNLNKIENKKIDIKITSKIKPIYYKLLKTNIDNDNNYTKKIETNLNIIANIRGLSNYYKNGLEIFEIHINNQYYDYLPCIYGKRVEIKLIINNLEYIAGIRSTEKSPIIWISPNILDLQNNKHKLVEVLTNNGFYKNEKVQLILVQNNIIELRKIREENSEYKLSEDYFNLIESIKILKDKYWVNEYFNLIKEAIDKFDIKENDPRISMSLPKNKKLPFTIGKRYIARPRKNGCVALIMPIDYLPQENDDFLIDIKDSFFLNNVRVAKWIIFDKSNGLNFSTELKNKWFSSIEKELSKSTKTIYRKFHKSIVYRVIVDLKFREQVLNEAFK